MLAKFMTFAAAAMVIAPPQADALKIKPQARSLQPGELVVLTVTAATRIDALRARVFGRDLDPFRVADRTWQVVAGIDLDVKPGTHVVSFRWTRPDDRATQTASYDLKVVGKTFRTRTLTVDNAFVNPPESAATRIADDARALNEAWESSTPRQWTSAFIAPVAQPANSAFGTRSVFNGQPRSPHGGADFASPAGTPVRAPNSGRVLIARDLYYTGGTVVVDHGQGLISLFAHLSKIDVKQGATVQVGEVVGNVGATGRVTGPHLHWAVKVRGARIDPLSLLAVLGPTVKEPYPITEALMKR